MVKQVVLPQALSIHSIHHGMHTTQSSHHQLGPHKDPFHQFEGLLLILVVVHMVAFGFWCYLLYASRKRKEGSSAASVTRQLADWRAPRDVLKAYQKAHIGKS